MKETAMEPGETTETPTAVFQLIFEASGTVSQGTSPYPVEGEPA